MIKKIFFLLGLGIIFCYLIFPLFAVNKNEEIIKILDSAWYHYKTHRNFEGDWWSGRYKFPSMIEADGRPNAFQDGGDVDDDGIKDINWQNPDVPFEVVVVSESASYALLRAVWMKDKETFDKVWKWTHDNLQRENIKEVYYWWDRNSPKNGWKSTKELGLEKDKLFSWRWVPNVANTGKDGVMYYRWRPPEGKNNPNVPWRDGWDCAADADYDIALALIFADSLWGSQKGDTYLNYRDHARGILKDLWEKTTIIVAGQRFVAGGDNIDSIEPGYLSPATYRIFNDFDPEHDWLQLVSSTYWAYKNSGKAVLKPWVDKSGKVHPQDPRFKKPRPNLVPDWFDVTDDGQVVDSAVRQEPEFGTDAFRSLWRIAMDKIWFNSPEANDYLKGPDNPTEFFKWCLFERPAYEGLKDYNTKGKLASIYWHNGDFCDYESNYEPELNDPAREVKKVGPRADSGAYGGYLSYFYAAGENEAVEKVLEPLITPEANGFSQTDYVIPPDWWEKESPENRARHVPPEKRKNPEVYVGKPYGPGDGWLCKNSDGYYWTVYDHSDWNAQGDYFSNTWAWLGLALYAGKARNLFVSNQKEPVQVKQINVYSDPGYKNKITKIIKQEKVYVELVGVDGNPRNRDWVYLTVESSDRAPECQPIKIKLAETGLNTGIYRGFLKIGLKSLEADNKIGASFENEITIYQKNFPGLKAIFQVGNFYLVTPLDNFNDGLLLDSSSLYWWQDGFSASGEPVIKEKEEKAGFLWLDENKKWNLVFTSGGKPTKFSGTISSDGEIKVVENYLGTEKKQKIPLKTSGNSFSFDIDLTKENLAGIVFFSAGNYLNIDVKEDGVYRGRNFYFGAARTPAYSLPAIVKTDNNNQSYFLSVSTEKKYEDYCSLKVSKKYNFKDYPYFGAAGLKGPKSDWSRFNEFKMYVYLEEDPGNIQVDIEDKNGKVATLNSYNPYRPEKGPGWYLWSSNFPKSLAVQRGVADPKPIKFRDFWKGWDSNEGKAVEIPDFDLKDIVNIQFSVGGGEKKDVTLYLAKMILVEGNYHSGRTPPEKIKQINFYKDKNYKILIEPNEVLNEGQIFIEVTGKDGDPITVDRFKLKVKSDDDYPGCEPIDLFLTETSRNSGVYRGVLNIGLESDYLKGQIGASEGSQIEVYLENQPEIKKEVKIGARKIIQIIDDFSDGVIFDSNPITWWTDELDPGDGRPGYTAGVDLGYFLWRDKDDVWHLRWSTDGKAHNFSGVIKSDGKINELNYSGKGQAEIKSPSKKEISFNSNISAGEEGFDFKGDGDYFIFDIKIDGRYYGRKIWIGRLPYKKAYDTPFSLKNKGITKTYQLLTSIKGYENAPFSMKVVKKYNGIKDYPYFGAWWGFSPELFDWSNVEEFKMWVYLPEDVGVIRVDLEDKDGNVVILNGYNPWDPQKGPGWYLWQSNIKDAIDVARGNAEPVAIKDRHFWKGWDENLADNVERTKQFDLKNIVNMGICLGGGIKKSAEILIGKVYLVKENTHVGFNQPKSINSINAYQDSSYKITITPEKGITSENVFLEVIGKDSNPATVDRIRIMLDPEDNFPGCYPIEILLVETEKNSGIYRGNFKIGLTSNPDKYQVGACRDSQLRIYSPNFKDNKLTLNISSFDYQYILDNFDDGKVFDEMPITWWTDELNPEGKPELEAGKDFGYFIWRDGQWWHLRWLGDNQNREISGQLATTGVFEDLREINFEKNLNFKEAKNSISFKKTITGGEAGFDFKVSGKKDAFLYFSLKIDGVSQGKKVFVGPKKMPVYALPFTLYANGSTFHYQLSASKEKAKSGQYSMKVTRFFGIKDYPYFGAWGLRGEARDWSSVDELSFWIYLKNDPGEVRVDIEDKNGTTAVINGYNPWDPEKGEGWYLWRSNNPLAWQAREGNCQPVPIKNRTFWKHWSVEKFDYEDVTDKIDLKNIVNIQFCIGGRETGIEFETLGTFKKPEFKEIICYIDDITLSAENFHQSDSLPKNVQEITFYQDEDYRNQIFSEREITHQNAFVKVTGLDSSPFSVDRIPLILSSSDNRKEAFPVKIILTETGRNTGIYLGKFKIDQESNQNEGVIGAFYKSVITASVPFVSARSIPLKVGQITYRYLIEDFSDGKVFDRVPVDWWTDDLDPEGKPEYRSGNDLGYYIWRDNKGIWHLRWSSDSKRHKFEGYVIAHKKPKLSQISKIENKKEKGKDAPKIIKAGFIEVKPFSLSEKADFSQNYEEIAFSEIRVVGEAGFDFKVNETEYLEFDLKIDDKYLGRKTFVGETGTKVYALPFSLYVNGITKHLWLSISKKAPRGQEFSLGVKKVPKIKDYPAFGLWGLKKKVFDLSDWTKFDRLKFMIYSPQALGSTRVEIEDSKGTVAILNGYDPVLFGNSNEGWYEWNSSFNDSPDVEEKVASPLSFAKRPFWKRWDLETNQKYVDSTSELDLKDICNIAFIVGGGSGETVNFNLGPIWLEKDNF